ncbi:hypothetical protein IscW_ISCW002959 [Ixodes scapularis]|uniref:Uncharacterized protein n=1 Tax=Ixodes scapularis TaxID=6945 RepID=B7PAI4_IXOSC|nr:hypothetical protein IscW_ISCW002959 [Ixodes scapularis]|eukprot:XP_002406887.1 hypothetical protein IscW_ISCW002959 [Ixodes scapularis]
MQAALFSCRGIHAATKPSRQEFGHNREFFREHEALLCNRFPLTSCPPGRCAEEVVAVAGGEVSLPCGAANNPFPGLAVGDEPCLLLWFREGSATPILSADARRGGGLHNAKVSHAPGLARSVSSGHDEHLESFGRSGLIGR